MENKIVLVWKVNIFGYIYFSMLSKIFVILIQQSGIFSRASTNIVIYWVKLNYKCQYYVAVFPIYSENGKNFPCMYFSFVKFATDFVVSFTDEYPILKKLHKIVFKLRKTSFKKILNSER